ncbi:hypothetical protein FSP39_014716 [Pinctada imbricata]|uniref:F-box domain-containing protein n=1 Tax=Pinctada imbricata TaxID=66713 RepID=A0AA88XPG2_PINIB|nr:hypothetical protein FSP39_014716 [Pinctada imbricata]
MKRQRVERGIFGIKKDPKNQILFSFQARDGEEWPSDSDDSDYCPYSDDDDASHKKKKSKKMIKKKRKDDDKAEASTSRMTTSMKCSRLPTEIWSKILMNVVNTQGPLPFLCRAAKVCSMWRDIVSQPQFWRTVDLSYGWIKSKDSTLRWLVSNRLSQCENISLQNWGNLSDDVLQTLADGCPRLTSINLSHCKKLGQQGLTAIIDRCQNLRDVNLAFASIKMPIIKHLISKHGTNLWQLNISGNSFTGAVLDLIVANCPNIEQLDISNSTFSSEFAPIDVYAFQKGCPKVRVLNLGNSKFKEKVVRGVSNYKLL